MPHHPLYPPLDVPASGDTPFTDYSRWRLRVSDGGRHTWHYMRTEEENAQWPQTPLDKYWLGLPTVS
jgi:lanosterol synthase